jgi:hypothetical protein
MTTYTGLMRNDSVGTQVTGDLPRVSKGCEKKDSHCRQRALSRPHPFHAPPYKTLQRLSNREGKKMGVKKQTVAAKPRSGDIFITAGANPRTHPLRRTPRHRNIAYNVRASWRATLRGICAGLKRIRNPPLSLVRHALRNMSNSEQ